ncbi:MAG: Gfo/Idh/MocA family oxidoreductase [Dolichospermum sp. LBC05a]|nr:Gfo/Idh/MocA family oxidoreductase [Dolichospermum sp. OL01]MCO5795780.1 Gfo/Idh/MocA family oxidoreductase [Dolichospermum sp. OL03]MCS6281875.1 Gfo/Idh/MocA family oxidoreductase [Dolichospermum sp.]QSV57449.1 MAG: Gfo/Idh/MocA family oxidoreductase [Dolichospermum sp. LBC05a]
MKQVIVVGAGNWGQNLIQNFYALEALAGIVEINPDLRSKVQARYPDVVSYADLQQALASDIPAIVFATPAPTHYKFAMAALAAGKDVFIEKPMTLQTEEAQKLAEYADQHSQILMVGHLLLYQPAITWMRDYLASGKAGKVLHVATQRAKLGKVRQEENVWWSFAPHDVSIVLDLLGNPPVERVQASGQSMLQPGIEDNVHADIKFRGGQTAHLHTSWYWPLLQRSTTVITERQMLVYDEIAQQVTVYDKGVDEQLNNRDEGSSVVNIAASEPLKIECQHFLQCLQTRETPRSDGWNGVAVVEILEKVEEALHD